MEPTSAGVVSGTAGKAALLAMATLRRLRSTRSNRRPRTTPEALKALAAAVAAALRPTDTAARFGGEEEFVVLLPGTPADEGQSVLTRLQSSLSGALFMHEHKQVFVTFSAGGTACRDGEAIEDALERADRALYEAKRSGKNRSCLG